MRFNYTFYTNKNNNIRVIIDVNTFYQLKTNIQRIDARKKMQGSYVLYNEFYAELNNKHNGHPQNISCILKRKETVEEIKNLLNKYS